MAKRYSIKVTYPSGVVAYMTHNGRSCWTKRYAVKHLREFVYLHGFKAELVEF
jgi:hypothetical protein